nr:MAG TPA: Endonuclease [Caudoviricetes sp.]
MSNRKYQNTKVAVDGIVFDSIREASRYKELKLLSRAGRIKDLRMQVKYELQPSYKLNGKTARDICYIADFVYYDVGKGREIVEDVKGYRTAVYKLKKKMFEYRYGKEIIEI